MPVPVPEAVVEAPFSVLSFISFSTPPPAVVEALLGPIPAAVVLLTSGSGCEPKTIGVVPVGNCQSCVKIVLGDWKSTYLDGSADNSAERVGSSLVLTFVLMVGCAGCLCLGGMRICGK